MLKTPLSVLLIDDELPICTAVCGLLQMTGFNASFVTSADEGFEYLKNNPTTDIVLLDVNLGRGMSGLEALEKIKSMSKYIQVVMFTSQDSLEIGLESMKRGALDFLAKPFDLKLFTKIAAVAHERRKIEQIRDLYFDMVIHDLKNPLQVIGGACEMLSDTMKDSMSPIQKKMFDAAESGVRQLQMIIGNVIGVTNFEKKSLIARHETFDIRDTIKNGMCLFEQVEFFYDSDIGQICTDKDLFLRVLTNLISNAIRYTMPGNKVAVRVECCDDTDLQVSVENVGSYIEPEMREVVFDKFLNVHSIARSVRGQNFGLGLTFSKLAVEAMGGKIWVEGDEIKPSTTFVFTVNSMENKTEQQQAASFYGLQSTV